MLKNDIYQQPHTYPQSQFQTDFRSNVTVLVQEKPASSFPQHGGYQDQEQWNGWHFSSEGRSICPCFVRVFSLAAGEWTSSCCVWSRCLLGFVVLKCICYCYAPKFVYRQRGNIPYIRSQEFDISIVEILAVCSKSYCQPRSNYYRKKQLCLGTKNLNANNKPVKIALPCFLMLSPPSPWGSVAGAVILVWEGEWEVLEQVSSIQSLSPGALWCSCW